MLQLAQEDEGEQVSKQKKNRKSRRRPPAVAVTQLPKGEVPRSNGAAAKERKHWPERHPMATFLSAVGAITALFTGAATFDYYQEQNRIADATSRSLLTIRLSVHEPVLDKGGEGEIYLYNAGKLPATIGPIAVQNCCGEGLVNHVAGSVIVPGETMTLQTCLPLGWDPYSLDLYQQSGYPLPVYVYLRYSDLLNEDRRVSACFTLSSAGIVECETDKRPVLPVDWQDTLRFCPANPPGGEHDRSSEQPTKSLGAPPRPRPVSYPKF